MDLSDTSWVVYFFTLMYGGVGGGWGGGLYLQAESQLKGVGINWGKRKKGMFRIWFKDTTGRTKKEVFCLMTHSTHFIYGYMVSEEE